jgi:hypothetical protein
MPVSFSRLVLRAGPRLPEHDSAGSSEDMASTGLPALRFGASVKPRIPCPRFLERKYCSQGNAVGRQPSQKKAGSSRARPGNQRTHPPARQSSARRTSHRVLLRVRLHGDRPRNPPRIRLTRRRVARRAQATRRRVARRAQADLTGGMPTQRLSQEARRAVRSRLVSEFAWLPGQ